MDLNALPTEAVLRPGLFGALVQFAVATVLAGIGVRAVRDPAFMKKFQSALWNRAVSWGCPIVFGLLFLTSTLSLVPSANGLFLDQSGFAERRLWMDRARRWDQVSEFRVVPKNNPNDWIIRWLYVPTTIEFTVGGGSVPPSQRGIETMDGNVGLSDAELARLLNAWRARATGQPER